MNGTSGFQDMRSSTSRHPSYRLLQDQLHGFGTDAWHILPTDDLLRMVPHVRSKNYLRPSSHDHIAFCADISAQQEKVPGACSVIKQRLIQGFLFLLLTITGGNGLAAESSAEAHSAKDFFDLVVVECADRFFAWMSVSSNPGTPIPPPPPPDPFEIVIGCRLTNCGLPVQTHSPIELRISVKSDLVASTVLGIENMSAANAAGIEILQGEVDRRDPLQWTIRPGVTHLRGFSVTRAMRPPVITFRPLPNKARVLALTERFREIRGLGDQDIGKIEIDIEQLLGTFVVSRKRILVKLRFCEADPPGPQDRITLQYHPGTPNPTVLINGHRSGGCIDSTLPTAVETHTGGSTIFLGNMLSNDSCYSEASIFLQDRAMRIKVIDSKAASTWTDAPTDNIPVDMQLPRIQVPVNLWVLWPDEGDNRTPQQGADFTREAARTDIAEANTLYGNTKSGIQFTPGTSPEMRIDEAIDADLLSATCDDVEPLFRLGYVPNQLNVYYVGYPPGTNGDNKTAWHCVTTDENIIIIRAAIKKRATLAHELGHALSLQTHAQILQNPNQVVVNGTSVLLNQVFDDTNIMWNIPLLHAVDNRSMLTKGQSFRANVYRSSALYRMMPALDTAEPHPGRMNCTENDASAQCPRIDAN